LHDKRVIILIKDLKTSATSPGHEKQVQEAHIIDLKQIGVARVGLDDARSGPAATVWGADCGENEVESQKRIIAETA
jgi:hypothetical protein